MFVVQHLAVRHGVVVVVVDDNTPGCESTKAWEHVARPAAATAAAAVTIDAWLGLMLCRATASSKAEIEPGKRAEHEGQWEMTSI